MRLLPGPFLLPLLLSTIAFAKPQAPAGPPAEPVAGSLNLQSFQVELRRIHSALAANAHAPDQITALEATLPSSWTVETTERKYEVPSEPLRSLLEEARSDPSRQAQRVGEAQEWVAEMEAEVDGYAATGEPSQANARAKLAQILAAREFGTVYKESAWDRLKDRVWAWIWGKLAELVRRMGEYPTASRVLLWLLLLGAVACIGLLVFRAWARRAGYHGLKAPAMPAVTQSWQEWVRAARLAADRGNFREAVHALYWAAIVHLEDSRVLPRERSRTLRERLRRLRQSTQSSAGEDGKLPVLLQTLTARLERTWYAGQPATQQDFLESLQLAEELGCRLQ